MRRGLAALAVGIMLAAAVVVLQFLAPYERDDVTPRSGRIDILHTLTPWNAPY